MKEIFSKRIKKFREDRKLTMRAVAKKIGVPESTYRDWEYGRNVPADSVVQLAMVFEVSVEELLGVKTTSSDSVETSFDRIVRDIRELQSRVIAKKD